MISATTFSVGFTARLYFVIVDMNKLHRALTVNVKNIWLYKDLEKCMGKLYIFIWYGLVLWVYLWLNDASLSAVFSTVYCEMWPVISPNEGRFQLCA